MERFPGLFQQIDPFSFNHTSHGYKEERVAADSFQKIWQHTKKTSFKKRTCKDDLRKEYIFTR